MVTLTIDGRMTQVPHGTTILAAANGLGIRIPTLCHVKDFSPSASCFLCSVEIEGRATLSPSCAMPAAEGMVVRTDSDEVRASRKMALELLFSDHVGDCIGPCRTGCPARLDIPGFISLVAEGEHRRSAEVVADGLTLPASLGRICPRLCEQRCRRCDAGEALAIGRLHQFAADADLASASPYIPRRLAASGKRVAIVGAGPAGLAAASHLLRRGHHAVLFDAHDEPGGMLRYGIPEFRLPRRVLDQEIGVVRALGAEFRMGQRMGRDVTFDELRRTFDAVFLAIGAQGSRTLDCPGESLAVPAVDFLHAVASAHAPTVGSDVVVIGGGNSAMDAARTALRLGAMTVTVLYRRSRDQMPCLMAEVEAGEAEGVRLDVLVAPVRIDRLEDGRLRMTCRRMRLGELDAGGRARSEPVPDSEFTVDATTVIAAVGQIVETHACDGSGLAWTGNGIAADPVTLATSLAGVFAGGDGVTGADVAVRAVAAGTLAAMSIDQYLGDRPVRGHPEMLHVLMGRLSDTEMAELFRDIEGTPRVHMPELAAAERASCFDEVEPGLSPALALAESRRCMRCGCWKSATCHLRQYGTEYGVDPLRFAGDRRQFHRDVSHAEIVYESGKCVLCGACVTATAGDDEPVGLTFVGRGFDATVGVPFGDELDAALTTVGCRAAEVCPTGALALKARPATHPLQFHRSRSRLSPS